MNQKKKNNLIETDDVILPRRFTLPFPFCMIWFFLLWRIWKKNPGIYYTMPRLWRRGAELKIFQCGKGVLSFSFCCGLQGFEIDMVKTQVKTIAYIFSVSFNNELFAGFWNTYYHSILSIMKHCGWKSD